ncbi:MAG: hypothetical protein IIA81_07195 [Thaumarchaeota archaeon]|nr:hypothetical protein [Nitrososphaerota archaeon]
MKFPGKCIVCNEKIEKDEIGFWAKDIGVKHEKCAEIKELTCGVCGGPAGCPTCEFRDSCDLERVSQICICKKCEARTDPYNLYQKSVMKKFRLLSSTA